MANEKKTVREPSFILALIPIVAMIGFMLYCFRGHSESGYHDAHMPLVLSIVVACIVGAICGHSFKEMLAGMICLLYTSPAGNANAVAEHAVMLMLMCAKRFTYVDRQFRGGNFLVRMDMEHTYDCLLYTSSVEPEPGNTVALTLDIDFQEEDVYKRQECSRSRGRERRAPA